jgi:hypothetical protein
MSSSPSQTLERKYCCQPKNISVIRKPVTCLSMEIATARKEM